MAWNAVMTNIVTNSGGTVDLANELSKYTLTTALNTQLAGKVDASSGSAADLAITNWNGDTHAVNKGYVDAADTALQSTLDDKAPVANPTFTGLVTLGDNATSGDHAIKYSQVVGQFVPIGGGSISGPISYGGSDYTTEAYVAANYALLTSFNTLQTTVDNKADTADLANYVPWDSGTNILSQNTYAVPPDPLDSSQRIATAGWVRSEINEDLLSKADLASPNFSGTVTIEGSNVATETYVNNTITTSIAVKANLADPVFSGTPKIGADDIATELYVNSAITTAFATPNFDELYATGAIPPTDNTTRVPTTAWVQQYVQSVIP